MSTKIADVIVPEVFNPYVVQKTMELSALYQSGIVASNPELDRLATSGGAILNMPYWEDLTGESEVLTDSKALTPKKITAEQDAAVLIMRGSAWSVNDLAKALSGDDPMKVIGDKMASFWAKDMQRTLIKILDGAFAGSGMTNKVLDITSSATTSINGSTFLDALQLMGDAKDELTGVVMHSATETQLRKNNLLDTYLDSENKPITTFMGKRVIVDDGVPFDTSSGKYTTYLFGNGAIGLGNGAAPVPTETDRDSLSGEDILINRRHFLLHPRGVRWMGGTDPDNAALANSSNWKKVYEDKAIRMVKFVHTL